MSRVTILVSCLVASLVGLVGFYLWPFLQLFEPLDAVGLVAAAFGLLLLFLIPVVYPLFRALRWPGSTPWPVRFAILVASIAYGSSSLLLIVLGLPVSLYLIYVAPQLQALGERAGEPVVVAGGFFANYWWLFQPFLIVCLTVVLTRALLPKWGRVVAALRG